MSFVLVNQYPTGLFVSYSRKNPIVRKTFSILLGLSTLLNSHFIHRTRYHSIGLSIRLVCPGNEQHCSQPEVELSQVNMDPMSSDHRHQRKVD